MFLDENDWVSICDFYIMIDVGDFGGVKWYGEDRGFLVGDDGWMGYFEEEDDFVVYLGDDDVDGLKMLWIFGRVCFDFRLEVVGGVFVNGLVDYVYCDLLDIEDGIVRNSLLYYWMLLLMDMEVLSVMVVNFWGGFDDDDDVDYIDRLEVEM